MQAERIFFVHVLKRKGGGADAFAALHDPNHMSDETFFGVWDAKKRIGQQNRFCVMNAMMIYRRYAPMQKKDDMTRRKVHCWIITARGKPRRNML